MWDGGSAGGSAKGASLSSHSRALAAAVVTPADFRIGYHSNGVSNVGGLYDDGNMRSNIFFVGSPLEIVGRVSRTHELTNP